MSELSENELERLRKLEQLRKQVQQILGRRLLLLGIILTLMFIAVLTVIYIRIILAPDRFEARISLLYYPKQTDKIKPFDDKQVLQIFSRRIMLQKFSRELERSADGRGRTVPNIELTQEKRQPNRYQITVYAPTEADAVLQANSFAELCIREYIEGRTLDLQKWMDAILHRKQDILADLRKIDKEKNDLTAPLLAASPQEDLVRLRKALSEQRAAQRELHAEQARLNARKLQLESGLKAVNPAMILHAQEIREYRNDLKQLNKELLLARQLYTEANPKLQALVSRRESLELRYRNFLAENGIRQVTSENLRTAELLNRELKDTLRLLQSGQEKAAALDQEIVRNSRLIQQLTEIFPRYQQLSQRSSGLQETIQKLEEQISGINYLLISVKNDVSIEERAGAAESRVLLSREYLIAGALAALLLTALIAAVIVLLEFCFGRVSDARELALYAEFRYLGALPGRPGAPVSAEEKKMILDSLYHEFQADGEERHLVFAGLLPGASRLPELYDALEWNYAMSGRKTLFLHIASAQNCERNYEEHAGMTHAGIVSYSGGRGFIPVGNELYLSPSELELVKNDLADLRRIYDLIFIVHRKPLTARGRLFEQMADLCEVSIILVGAARTLRKHLRHLLVLQQKTRQTVMTVLSTRNYSRT